MNQIISILLQTLFIGMILAVLVVGWVFISYYAARISGRPWSLGQNSNDCNNGCGNCNIEISCKKTGN